MPESFQGVIIQIDVGDLYILIIQRFYIHSKSMVLGSDFNFSGFEIFHRLVSTPVAEFQLKSLTPQGQTKKLMPQTNTKNGPVIYQGPDGFNGFSNRLGITRTVG